MVRGRLESTRGTLGKYDVLASWIAFVSNLTTCYSIKDFLTTTSGRANLIVPVADCVPVFCALTWRETLNEVRIGGLYHPVRRPTMLKVGVRREWATWWDGGFGLGQFAHHRCAGTVKQIYPYTLKNVSAVFNAIGCLMKSEAKSRHQTAFEPRFSQNGSGTQRHSFIGGQRDHDRAKDGRDLET